MGIEAFVELVELGKLRKEDWLGRGKPVLPKTTSLRLLVLIAGACPWGLGTGLGTGLWTGLGTGLGTGLLGNGAGTASGLPKGAGTG